MLQVTLLAGGQLMYHGERSDVTSWFESLGYTRQLGEESDWLLDLVATGFDKPRELFGNALMSPEDTSAAAAAFMTTYLKVMTTTCMLQGAASLTDKVPLEMCSVALAVPAAAAELQQKASSSWLQLPTGVCSESTCALLHNAFLLPMAAEPPRPLLCGFTQNNQEAFLNTLMHPLHYVFAIAAGRL
jgi:hypothetical protein